jgi:uncharacterized YccA/Bax inhibitor family protein
MMMRTANPALNSKTFEGLGYVKPSETMTLMGTVHKSGLLLLFALLSASWVWSKFFSAGDVAAGAQAVAVWTMVGAIGGLIAGLVTAFKKEWAGKTAPVYALLEGLFLGGFSAILEARFHGIVIQAVSLTFGTLLCLLLAYRSGLIKVTENFKLGVFAATGAIGLFYLVTWILSFFHVGTSLMMGSSPLSIGISVFIVIVAALNLVMDFDFIEKGAEAGVPKYMEWYSAFGLLVTLIWLYVEILRLLTKLRSRD